MPYLTNGLLVLFAALRQAALVILLIFVIEVGVLNVFEGGASAVPPSPEPGQSPHIPIVGVGDVPKKIPSLISLEGDHLCASHEPRLKAYWFSWLNESTSRRYRSVGERCELNGAAEILGWENPVSNLCDLASRVANIDAYKLDLEPFRVGILSELNSAHSNFWSVSGKKLALSEVNRGSRKCGLLIAGAPQRECEPSHGDSRNGCKKGGISVKRDAFASEEGIRYLEELGLAIVAAGALAAALSKGGR